MLDEDFFGAGSNSELAELLGSGPADFAEPRKRDFAPWHRPRKQYVRSVQWCREISSLVRESKIRGDFRYFTLPGADLLDVRQIARSVCASNELRLTYLGFDTAMTPSDPAQSDLYISQFGVNRMTNVNMESEVFPGDFRGVGDPDSIHSQRMRRGGAFHAINIDLCGGVAGKQGNDGLPNYFAAVKALLEHQHYWRQEFLFFLTTRIDEGSVAAHHRGRVPAIAQNAADSCEEYVEQFLHSWKIDADGEKLVVASSVSADEAFMLGLTQWIVDAGVEIGLKSRVRSIMTYRTGKGTEGPDDIASIAIRFKPEPDIASDVHGMVSPAPDAASSASRRCEQSALIPRRVADRTLVDLILRNDASALDKCVQQSSELLEAAGYDPDAYVRWVWEEKERYEAA